MVLFTQNPELEIRNNGNIYMKDIHEIAKPNSIQEFKSFETHFLKQHNIDRNTKVTDALQK
jgi:hypothetical protein